MAGRKKRLKRLKWWLATFGVVTVAGLAGLWLSFQHVPAWYRPVEIAPDRMQSVRNDLLRVRSDFSERLLLAQLPFEYKLLQDQINDWFTAREEMWPLSREWLPPWMSDPLVIIDKDGIRLAATLNHGLLRTVGSAKLEIRADEGQIRVRLIEVNSGSLPIPHKYVLQELQNLDRQGWSLEMFGKADRTGARLSGLLEGVSLPNVGTWVELGVSGKSIRRRFRVVGLRLEPGALVVTIRPLEFRDK